MPDRDLSGHPVDRLIHELVQTRRNVAPDEIQRILDRIATAEFDTRLIQVESFEQGLVYERRRLMPRDESLFVHLVRRAVIDKQWSLGTTAEQYVKDLRRVATVGGVRLAVYQRRGGSIAALLALTHLVIPAEQRGPRWLPELFVVYSADRGIIVSGYQVEGLATISIPEDARWLH
jgi:hypothetical protein